MTLSLVAGFPINSSCSQTAEFCLSLPFFRKNGTRIQNQEADSVMFCSSAIVTSSKMQDFTSSDNTCLVCSGGGNKTVVGASHEQESRQMW